MPPMQIYIDTANLEEIRQAAAMGVLDGVTTNPSLVAKEGVDFHSRLKEICDIVPGPVSAEVVATEHDAMIAEAEELIPIAGNIKLLPVTGSLPAYGRIDVDVKTGKVTGMF